MNDSAWHWARLDRKGIALVQETESALGADFVLAYGPGGPVADASILAGLAPVALTESELECLQGVESKLGIVAVAYSRAHRSRPQCGCSTRLQRDVLPRMQ